MTILGLLIAVFATVLLVWLAREGKIPAPFTWILYAFVIIIWVVILIWASGVGGDFLNRRIV